MEALKYKIEIRKSPVSRIAETDFDNLQFGKYFTDHMLVADYDSGDWNRITIEPFGRISLMPSTTALHYGQAIFEGMKAYRGPNGEALLFRPEENWKRMNRSADRMCMPPVPEGIFMDGIRQLVSMDREWIPGADGSSLYIRPFMFATDEYTGIRISEQYKFIVYCCPVGAYYPDPVRLMVTKKYVRAFPGGTGEAKAAGNYGASLYGAREAKSKGFNNILWLDGIEHRYVEECGTMNVMFIIDGKAITPALSGTVLHGTTRAAAIQLLRDMGLAVEERKIEISEIWNAHAEGRLQEAFGLGTAATIAPVSMIGQDGSLDNLAGPERIDLPPVADRKIGPELLKRINDIRTGRVEDPYGWVEKLS